MFSESIEIECESNDENDWSKKINRVDSFQVEISSYEFGDFLFNKAYE